MTCPHCKAPLMAIPDGLTVEAGGHIRHEDRSQERCTVCLRTVEECYEEEA
jgi:hypothetical protein